jgi:hypothetical protein
MPKRERDDNALRWTLVLAHARDAVRSAAAEKRSAGKGRKGIFGRLYAGQLATAARFDETELAATGSTTTAKTHIAQSYGCPVR